VLTSLNPPALASFSSTSLTAEDPMSRPTRFLVFLNSTLSPYRKKKDGYGLFPLVFRLVVKIAKGFSVVKGSNERNHTSCKDLSPSDRCRRSRPAVLFLRHLSNRYRLRGFFRPRRPRHEETHGPALPVLRKDADERPPRQPRPQRHESQVARESEEHPRGRGRRAAEGLRLHALHPIREDHEGEPEDEAGRVAWVGFWVPGLWFLQKRNQKRLIRNQKPILSPPPSGRCTSG